MQAVGAVVHDAQGRLLLVLRGREPSAGVWSIPGGKVEPGEDPDVAIVREIREELACEVAVVDHLAGEQPVKDGYTLRVAVARLLGGEPVPHEHDAIRWLGPDDLDVVPWLEPDLPFLPELRERLLASARDSELSS